MLSLPRHQLAVGVDDQPAAAPECCRSAESIWMAKALHDLAQPLTALECGLFLSTMEPESGADQLRQAIGEALVQCQRMMAEVRAMQDHLHYGNGAACARSL